MRKTVSEVSTLTFQVNVTCKLWILNLSTSFSLLKLILHLVSVCLSTFSLTHNLCVSLCVCVCVCVCVCIFSLSLLCQGYEEDMCLLLLNSRFNTNRFKSNFRLLHFTCVYLDLYWNKCILYLHTRYNWQNQTRFVFKHTQTMTCTHWEGWEREFYSTFCSFVEFVWSCTSVCECEFEYVSVCFR